MDRHYEIGIPIAGGQWYPLCVCVGMESLLDVISSLMGKNTAGVELLQVRIMPKDYAPPPPF